MEPPEPSEAEQKAKVRALLASDDPLQAFTMPTSVNARGYYYLKSLSLQDVKELRTCTEGETNMKEQKEIYNTLQMFLKLPMKRNGDRVTVNVRYSKKDEFPGRLWSPVTSLWGPFRSLLLIHTVEADMACCMQVCIREACWAFDIERPQLDEYTRSKEDRERLLQAYMDAVRGGCTRGAAKDMYQMALTSEHPIKSAKGAYKAFDEEAKRIQKELMGKRELQWFKTFCKNGPGGIPGSFISHVFNFIECKCLLAVHNMISDRFGEDATVALVYDGLNLRLDASERTQELLDQMKAACNEVFPRIDMRWEYKEPDRTIKTKKTRKVIGELSVPDSFKTPDDNDGFGGDSDDGFAGGGLDPVTQPAYEELFEKFTLGRGEDPTHGHGKVGSTYIDTTKAGEGAKVNFPTLMDAKHFKDEYKHMRHYWEEKEEDKDGNPKTVTKDGSFIDKWMTDPRCDPIYLHDKEKRYYWKFFGMYPKKELCPPDCYNTFPGIAAETMEPINPADPRVQEGLRCILEFFLMLTNNDKPSFDFLLDFLAHMVQYPDVKIGIMLCLVGKQGAGKTWVWKLIERIIGERGTFASDMPEKDVWGDNNSRMAEALAVRVAEANKSKMAGYIGSIRTKVSEVKIRVRTLYCTPTEVKNYSRFFIDTNDLFALPDTDDERRFFIVFVNDARVDDEGFWTELAACIEGDGSDAIIRAFYEFLMARPIKRHYYKKDIPVGAYQRDLKAANRALPDKFVQHLVEDRPIDELEFTLSSEDIGKKWKKWQEGSKDADRSVESITTSLGMAKIKGVGSKPLHIPGGGISRVWCFQSEEFLRKRYGLDTITNEERAKEKARKERDARFQEKLARFDSQRQDYNARELNAFREGLHAGDVPPRQASPSPSPPRRSPSPSPSPPRRSPSPSPPPPIVSARRERVDCAKLVDDWAKQAIARQDGEAQTGDLSNKNETFTRECYEQYSAYVCSFYNADPGTEVLLDPKALEANKKKIICALEKEWVAAGRSWAAAGTAGDDHGDGAPDDAPVHPSSPISGGSAGGIDVDDAPEYEAAFVLLARTNVTPPMVLLTHEKRGGVEKLGLLGGKKETADRGEPKRTAAREAWEETNEKLSTATRLSIERGDCMLGEGKWVGRCKAYVFVHELEGNADAHVDGGAGKAAQRDRSSTEQLGVKWVSVRDLLDPVWRRREMHRHFGEMVDAVCPTLTTMLDSGGRVEQSSQRRPTSSSDVEATGDASGDVMMADDAASEERGRDPLQDRPEDPKHAAARLHNASVKAVYEKLIAQLRNRDGSSGPAARNVRQRRE